MALDFLLVSNEVDRLIFNVVGILLSVYALHVELRKEANPKYRAACDIGSRMSCSRVLTSSYGKGFGIVGLMVGKNSFLNQRNCTVGIIFYLLQILAGLVLPPWLSGPYLFYTSVVSVVGSLYLAIVLIFVLHDLCLVCFGTYVVNGALLYLNKAVFYQ